MAIEITQPKIASLAPTWQAFRGVTILFSSLGVDAAHRVDETLADAEPAHELFRELAARMAALTHEPWRSSYGLCPLPPASYHMTLADLVHDGNMGKLPDAQRGYFGGRRIAEGREYPSALSEAVRQSGLLDIGPMTFRPDAITILNRSALVLTLKARDADRYEAAMAARQRLANVLASVFHITLQPLTPHVSLAYFANKDCGEIAAVAVAELSRSWLPQWQSRAFSFAQPAPYVFADMATYRRE